MSFHFKILLMLCIYCTNVASQISTFSNPVLDINTRDAIITKINKIYYLVHTDGAANELRILKSPFLTDFRNAERGLVYKLPSGYTSFSPSSFFAFQNNLYLYFHMNSPSVSYRMFVVRAIDPANPLGPWTAPIRLMEHTWNETQYHGAVLHTNGELYLVFNSPLDTKLNLYIIKMHSPTEVLGPVLLLKEPTEDWECFGGCYLEAPSFLYHRDIVYLVHSASLSHAPESSISYMSIQIGLDPMNISNWESAPGPVFQGNEEESVFSIRCPEFTTSPDRTETWMLYTASTNSSNTSGSSRVRIEKIEWDSSNGTPKFPVARGNGYQQKLPTGEPQKFLNPVRDEYSGDVHVYNDAGIYYMVTTNSREVIMLKSNKLYDFRDAEKAVVYTVPEEHVAVSARIFELSGDMYLYFHMRPINEENRMYVLKAENKSNLMQNWSNPTKLLDDVFDANAAHGTVLQHDNQLYFVWVHGNNASVSMIYIALMSSPTQVIGPAVLLKEPREPWECEGSCATDYPFFLYNNNSAILVYTASRFTNPSSSLSLMIIETGRNPLDVTSWYTSPSPVYTRNDAEEVFATSHASFTTSPDGLETWMIHLASNDSTSPNANWKVRLEKISWDENTGAPIFPKAHGFTHPQAIPSYFEYFTNPVTDESTIGPGVFRLDDFYYMVTSSDSTLEIWQSGQLTNFRNAVRKTVFSVADGYTITESSKMHIVKEHLYIYFSMKDQNSTSKLFVLQAHDSRNPMGKWNNIPMPLAHSWNYSATHASVLEHGDNFYLSWITPHPATGFNSIFIAKLQNATHVIEPFNLLRHPVELWECDGGCSNESPAFIYNEGTAYMVLSVGSACTGGNALTFMSIGKTDDPLNVVDWNKAPGKVFNENPDDNVFCAAHATFTVSPDQSETWMMYHATDSPHPDAIKTARIEKINWDSETGEPVFPEPHGLYHQQLIPRRK